MINEFKKYAEDNNLNLEVEDLPEFSEVKDDYIKLAKLFLEAYHRISQDFWKEKKFEDWIRQFENHVTYIQKELKYHNSIPILNRDHKIIKYVGENYFDIADFVQMYLELYSVEVDLDFISSGLEEDGKK